MKQEVESTSIADWASVSILVTARLFPGAFAPLSHPTANIYKCLSAQALLRQCTKDKFVVVLLVLQTRLHLLVEPQAESCEQLVETVGVARRGQLEKTGGLQLSFYMLATLETTRPLKPAFAYQTGADQNYMI